MVAEPHGPSRWSNVHRALTTAAELGLEDGALQIGAGRRWLVAKDGTYVMAPQIFPEHLGDVRRVESDFLFLGDDGTVRLTRSPLGDAVETRVGPRGPDEMLEERKVPEYDLTVRAAIAKSTLLVASRRGELFRSADYGKTWSATAIPLDEGEVLVSLAANERGEALVAIHPQRLLLSTDDGATWSAIASPGIGARKVFRARSGELFLQGRIETARLSSGKLELASAPPFTDAHGGPESFMRDHVGDRLLAWSPSPDRQRFEVRLWPLSGTRATAMRSFLDEPATESGHLVSGGEGHEVVLAFDHDDGKGIRLHRTSDDGATWTLSHADGSLGSDTRVLVAPDWVAIVNTCTSEASCASRFRRGDGAWSPFLPEDAYVRRAAWDAGRDRIVIAATVGDEPALFVGSRDAAPTRVPLDARGEVQGLGVDEAGTIRLALRGRIETVRPDLSRGPTLYLPPAMARSVDALAFAGSRVFASSMYLAWESADGGEHWAQVGQAGLTNAASCSASGCLVAEAVRVGWDLPDPSRSMLASTSAPPSDAKPKPPIPVAVSCKTTAKWTPFPGGGAQPTDEGGFVALVEKEGAYVDSITAARGAAAPKTVKLLPPLARNDESGTKQYTLQNARGVVLVRLAPKVGANAGAKKQPPAADVELAWYVAATGKHHRAKLPTLPGLAAADYPQALVTLTDGGVAFVTQKGDSPLYFAHDGKVETLPRPKAGYISGSLEKAGDRIVLLWHQKYAIEVTFTADRGKTWVTKNWSLGAEAEPSIHDGQLAILLAPPGPADMILGVRDAAGILPLTTFGDDPPKTIRPEGLPELSTGTTLVPCPPKSRGATKWIDRRWPVADITVDGVETRAQSGVVRIESSGATCTDRLDARGFDGDRSVELFLGLRDPAHAWAVRAANAGTFEARLVSCTLP